MRATFADIQGRHNDPDLHPQPRRSVGTRARVLERCTTPHPDRAHPGRCQRLQRRHGCAHAGLSNPATRQRRPAAGRHGGADAGQITRAERGHPTYRLRHHRLRR